MRRCLARSAAFRSADGRLRGHAKDPIAVGYALEAIVAEDHWRRTGADLLVLGAGGSSMALTLYLHDKAKRGGDAPARIVVTALDDAGFADIREVHRRAGFAIPIDYVATPDAWRRPTCLSARCQKARWS